MPVERIFRRHRKRSEGHAGIDRPRIDQASGRLFPILQAIDLGAAQRLAVLRTHRRVGKSRLQRRVKRRRIPAYRRQIGMVFQDHRLLYDRPVADNVALPLVIAGVGIIVRPSEFGNAVAEALAKLEAT